MAELVHQTWTRVTGRPWSDAAKGGFTSGSYADNIALQKRLLGGWNPYTVAKAAPAATAKPAAKATTSATPKPGTVFRAGTSGRVYLMGSNGVARWITSPNTLRAMGFTKSAIAHIPSLAGISIGANINAPPPSTSVPVAPGITAQQWEAALALQRETALESQAAEDERVRLQEARDADARRLQEAQLAANPADFVAYELYKRSLVEQGFQPEGAVRSDVDIQNLFSTALDLNEGASAGIGQFGVDIPATQSISRSELQGLSKTAIDTLSSFLRGGVDTGEGEFQGVNPADFFTELEEGLVPVLPGQRTQFVF